jgi:hypothetical protein
MPVNHITPLAPAVLLLLGAALVLVVGPVLSPRRRHEFAAVVAALALLGLVLASNRSGAEPLHVLIEWLGEPGLAARLPAFEPFVWGVVVSLLAVALAVRGMAWPAPPLHQAMFFVLGAAACGVILAGTYHTLAFAVLLFDVVTALFALAAEQPIWGDSRATGRAVARLALGVLTSTAVVAAAPGNQPLPARPFEPGDLFALTIWLRVGLYPLLEADLPAGFPLPAGLVWHTLTLAVGLYLASTGLAPWLVWPLGLTAVLHAARAWLEPAREGALVHAAYALAGGLAALAAAGGGGDPALVAGALSILTALVALTLTPAALGRPDLEQPKRLWLYLPPLLATLSLLGLPFTLGWPGRGALYRAVWSAGLPGALALVVVAEGAALSILYPFWVRLLGGADLAASESNGAHGAPAPGGGGGDGGMIWPGLGAALACIPFLVPVLAPRLLPGAAGGVLGAAPGSALLGLIGALLWAFFLGYGRPRLLAGLPFPPDALLQAVSMGWLARRLGRLLDGAARLLLRVRAVVEGEHYLAWAVLLALAVGLYLVLR